MWPKLKLLFHPKRTVHTFFQLDLDLFLRHYFRVTPSAWSHGDRDSFCGDVWGFRTVFGKEIRSICAIFFGKQFAWQIAGHSRKTLLKSPPYPFLLVLALFLYHNFGLTLSSWSYGDQNNTHARSSSARPWPPWRHDGCPRHDGWQSRALWWMPDPQFGHASVQRLAPPVNSIACQTAPPLSRSGCQCNWRWQALSPSPPALRAPRHC